MLAEGKKRPELLARIYDREVLLWMTRLDAQGYTMTGKPSLPRYTPCPDPFKPAGTYWAIVTAPFFHHGALGVFSGDQWQEFQGHKESIGAAKPKKNAGVARYLEGLPPEQLAQTVAAAKPAKERDDDFD